MEKTTRLMSVVAIAMVLMIAFSGVAAASWLAEFTPENKIGYDSTMTGDQGFDFWKSSSKNLFLDNPTLAFGKVVTEFNKNFNAIKSTGDTSTEFGFERFPIANSKEMNAYSKLLATDVQATTRAEVGMTDDPVLNYKIDAEGTNEGSMAEGRIAAGMSVYVADGSDGGLGSILLYDERSSASGSFVFHKAMSYTSGITTP